MNNDEKRAKPTKTQERVYFFMVEYFYQNDQLPPTRVIQEKFSWSSQTAAMAIINKLTQKGWLQRNDAGKYKFTRPIRTLPTQ